MQNIQFKEICQAARQIQDILERKDLEFALWPNVKGEKCIWIIKRGDSPWKGARIQTLNNE